MNEVNNSVTLKSFAHTPIDWNLAPTDAVTMYLEWGNNNWHGEHPPVRSKEDVALYFVVDTWGEHPIVRLVRRNSEKAEDMLSVNIPQNLMEEFKKDYADLKGIYAPSDSIKAWLHAEMGIEE